MPEISIFEAPKNPSQIRPWCAKKASREVYEMAQYLETLSREQAAKYHPTPIPLESPIAKASLSPEDQESAQGFFASWWAKVQDYSPSDSETPAHPLDQVVADSSLSGPNLALDAIEQLKDWLLEASKGSISTSPGINPVSDFVQNNLDAISQPSPNVAPEFQPLVIEKAQQIQPFIDILAPFFSNQFTQKFDSLVSSYNATTPL